MQIFNGNWLKKELEKSTLNWLRYKTKRAPAHDARPCHQNSPILDEKTRRALSSATSCKFTWQVEHNKKCIRNVIFLIWETGEKCRIYIIFMICWNFLIIKGFCNKEMRCKCHIYLKFTITIHLSFTKLKKVKKTMVYPGFIEGGNEAFITKIKHIFLYKKINSKCSVNITFI